MKIVIAIALIALALASLIGCSSNPAPEAGFSATPTTGYVPLGVQFIDRSIGHIDSWQWDFDNDGIVDSTIRNPWHTYKNAGNYTVSLTVIGPDGSATEVKIDYLKFIAYPRLVDFVAEPRKGAGVTAVQFTDNSVGNVTGWAWDFESDGIIDSNEQNPIHTYVKNGLYSVTLTITTATHMEDTLTKRDYIFIAVCSA